MGKAERETIAYTNWKREQDAIEASKRDEDERKKAIEKKEAEEAARAEDAKAKEA